MSPAPESSDLAAHMLRQLLKSWTDSAALWSAWSGAMGSVLTHRGAPAAEAVMTKIADPATWAAGSTPLMTELNEILGLPRFADLPGLEDKTMPSAAPAMELAAAGQKYLMVAAPVWAQACQRFQTEATEHRAQGDDLDSAAAALDLWNTVLDRTLMEFNRSEEFGKAQQRFLTAAMHHRQQLRRLAEQTAESVDLPTRTEMNDVYRRLHDLQREVHSLRRDLRAATARPPAKPAMKRGKS